MTILTVYSDRFDSQDNVVGNGMSGKVYVERYDGNDDWGQEFKNIDEALDYCDEKHIHICRVDFNYLSSDGTQRFVKFKVT